MIKMSKLLVIMSAVFTLSVLLSACGSDDTAEEIEKTFEGTYEIKLDGAVVKEGSVALAGAAQDNAGTWINTVTMGDGSFSILVSQFPRSIGSSVTMDEDGDPGVTFLVGEEIHVSFTGTIKRISGSKIEFTGESREAMSSDVHTISGYIESEGYKLVK